VNYSIEAFRLLCEELRTLISSALSFPPPAALPVYIAGGAVRDLLLDRKDKIRDVDVWIYTPDIERTRETVKQSGLLGHCSRSIGNAQASLGRNGEILAIDYYNRNGVEINLIYMLSPVTLVDLVNAFDFTVNQAGICSFGLHTSAAFRDDVEAKVLRVSRKDAANRYEKRRERMIEKFPDWSFVDDLPAPIPGGANATSFGY
jgi:hypothetical protein